MKTLKNFFVSSVTDFEVKRCSYLIRLGWRLVMKTDGKIGIENGHEDVLLYYNNSFFQFWLE